MSMQKFVPDDFEVPASLETEYFRLRMLSVDDVEKDYEAVMESRDLLHKMFGGPWPREGFTLEENLKDLQRHQEEFLDRKAFAYTVCLCPPAISCRSPDGVLPHEDPCIPPQYPSSRVTFRSDP